MRAPGVMAQVADLMGHELDRPQRPSEAEVARDLADGEVRAATNQRRQLLAVYAVNGEIYAVPDRCPHDGGLLSDGYVDGGKLVCSRHGWEFDARTGTCAGRRSHVCPKRIASILPANSTEHGDLDPPR